MKPGVRKNEAHPMNRRRFLAATGTAAMAAQIGIESGGGASAPKENNLIRVENRRQGTRDWMLTRTRIDPKTQYRCPWIEGYCSRTSVRAGERISFHVSTNPPSAFTLDIYRTGFYGGAGARHIAGLGPVGAGSIRTPPRAGRPTASSAGSTPSVPACLAGTGRAWTSFPTRHPAKPS